MSTSGMQRDEVLKHHTYYNVTHPHRSLNLDPPAGARHVVNPPGARLRAQPVLGGLHYAYEWAA